MFYLNEVLSMKKGEELKGEFTCKPNENNHRDLDLSVNYAFKVNDLISLTESGRV